ncbi:MAG: ABC transporter permease subunit [Kiritimatiellia bacterium]|jgi:ABC-type glycerol-3-phosphate transport system permease component|nr:ABC transporter permease subunit [Kiritimatiellia bacterium]MDP6630606.1 ABC transporter permease subunit [Kiritimatiellia bacterium]MDP6811311.1 ABC transporter permease subunit [Kiritimatiellia bacterium]MDP7024617.1 ABC transporter permease subunit [Kiritimatiellia bacterium]
MEAKRIHWRQVKHHWEIYLFIIPTLVAIGLFIYYPAASGIYHSFFRWNGADISEWQGFGNYADLLSSSLFWRSFRNAFMLGMWNVIKMIPPLFVAVAIHRCRSTRMQFFYRILFVIPMVVPPLIIALIWRSFFFEATSGYLNQFIEFLNLRGILNTVAPFFGWGEAFSEGGKPAWLGDPRLIFTACVVWGFPWVSSLAVLTHLAKLQSISKDVYEAGDIDGVSWWSKFTKIELPLITGSIYIMLVFTIIGTIKDAGMILALAGFEGGPGGRVDVPALFMLRKAFIDQKMGYACAAGIILMLIVMVLQKLSTLMMSWSTLRTPMRLLLKVAVFGIGLAAMVLGRMWVLGGVLVLAALPYQLLRQGAVSLLAAVPGLTAWNAQRIARCPSGVERYERAVARRQTPLFRLGLRAGDGLLRGMKHGYIWMVLAFAILPLYLMLIVSFKDNTQFYQAPTVLTQPMHPENWRVAWQMITPTLANSVFLSVSSTLLMLFIAMMGAYFFARVRMPLSNVFWNAILVLMMLPMIANMVPLFRLLRDLSLLNTLSALILVGAAQGQIFAIFMLRNFVSDIPQDLYEAAEIDGASHFRQMWTIVLPLSGPILGTVGVMHFMTAWNDFVLPLIVMRDHARLPVMVQLIRMAGEYIKLWGPLMAGYAMAAIPIIILFTFSMKFFVRGMTEGAVKG